MMDPLEERAEIRKAKRIVNESEQRVATQRKLVQSLRPGTSARKTAERLLSTFETTLASERTHLDLIQNEHGATD